MCFHCCLTLEDFGEIIGHCESHFNENVKYDIDLQPQEFHNNDKGDIDHIDIQPPDFVNCSVVKPQSALKLISPMCNTTSKKSRTVTNQSTHFNMNADVPVRKHRRKVPVAEEVPQNCPICEVWCDNFQEHIKNVHDINFRVYQCFMCSKFLKTKLSLRRHLTSTVHNKPKSPKCYHCEMEPPIGNQSDPRRHKCLFCKLWFANHIEFKIHFRDAHNKDADNFFHKRSNCNIFTCYVCEREFPLRYYLVAHMKTHHDKFLQHQCPKCGKRVRTFGQLTQHLKTHEGKIYTCNQCDKQFPFYARLRLHMLCHETELKYECDVCSKKFKMRKYLTVHKAVHSNLKRYACKFCDATFNFTSGRRAHEKSQHKTV